ncbi:MAG TPA: transcription termination factor NusA [Candidatus Omnitrophota bacterium]|nr:transcription termination factor NusA [Candidatus Omnitrophota bacterium]HPD85013.1 transcription termination factor NusA [Candidatus Omnitrophota bacterium]HRZ03871.1 transcription termination factor NusA [Candidatus Omnitrophota bacterium]
MDSELLSILEQLERDKGIDKEILIQAVEAAVASAARKAWNVELGEEVKVVLDRKTGKLSAFAGGQEIKSKDFGRIAAQTAKQVVIQKIREAEKDVVFTEYQARIGQIVNGGVYRFDRGNIIVDLGKSEAFVPKSEQSPKEEFKQGDRIRAYVLDVKKDNKGPQIVLSRANPNFVKRLFELEVPEIYDGIVEIKAISRDAGERTKIAVYSKDEKVDCVGACVGMRGSRVKGVVSELHGEKIDIVRYSADMKEYIQAALSPAQISQIQLNKEAKKASIIVADDQLSLAIGKHGQNVRLASKLIGWELDIRSVARLEEEKKQAAEAALPKEEVVPEGAAAALTELTGVGEKLVEALKQAGWDNLEKISQAKVEELTEVKGVGKVKAEKIIKEAKKITKK